MATLQSIGTSRIIAEFSNFQFQVGYFLKRIEGNFGIALSNLGYSGQTCGMIFGVLHSNAGSITQYAKQAKNS